MRNRALAILFALVVAPFIFHASASAQGSPPCNGWFIWYFPDPIPAGATCYVGQGNFAMTCYGPNGKCPPPAYCPKCQTNGGAASKPINLTNGNTYIEEQDVRIPGLGGLSLQRTWNSIWPSTISTFQSGMFGQNWRSTYEERIIPATPYVLYLQGDGAYWYFGAAAGSSTNYTVSSPASRTATLVQGSTTWTLTFKNGEQRIFDLTSGSLLQIVDRNGNTTSLTYDGLNRLTTVTDPTTRTMTFTYASGSSTLVTAVSTSAGISLSYAYDGSGRLTQVTNPDSSTTNFTYNGQSLISNVTDSHGVSLESHTYDSQKRGLTASRAGGVDSVTVTYP